MIRRSQLTNGIQNIFEVIASTRRKQVRNCRHVLTILAHVINPFIYIQNLIKLRRVRFAYKVRLSLIAV